MGRVNPLQKIPDKIASSFKRDLASIEAFKAVPFGEEEVSPQEFKARFSEMSEFDLKKVFDRYGQAEVLRKLRGG